MAFKLGQRGQMTVYVETDNVAPLLDFAADHPIASASDITNAALRFYFLHAKDGVDGRLRPLNVSGTSPTHDAQLKTILEDLTAQLAAQRRVVWTEEQRKRASEPRKK